MNAPRRRARALAFLLDLLICAAAADAAGLLSTAVLWSVEPLRPAGPWIWLPAGGAGAVAFLLRDSRGGRARRWFALEARDEAGNPPGRWGSIRRNLPLVIPFWTLPEAWPVLRDGAAQRPSDRRLGIRIHATD